MEKPGRAGQVDALIREIQRYLALVEALRRSERGGGEQADEKRT
jgi:hypothetical protein